MLTDAVRNEKRYYVRSACLSVANLYATGTLLQTFLSVNGVSSEMIGTFTATLSVVQMLVILLSSAIVDGMKNPIKAAAACMTCMPVYFLVALPFALWNDVPVKLLFGVTLTAGIVQNLFGGLNTVLDYRIPFLIIDMRRYGKLCSVAGLIGGVVMVVFSTVTTWLTAVFDFNRVIAVMYVFSLLGLLAGAVVTAKCKPVFQPPKESSTQKVGLRAIFRLRAFWILLLPNLMRGFCSGVNGMLATIGIFELGLNASQGAALSIVFTAMALVGAFCCMKLSGRMYLPKIYLLFSAMICCALPMVMAGHTFPVFVAAYVVVLLATSICDWAVPVLISKVIPYECIGSYTSLRMGTHTGGIALGSLVAGLALGKIPIVWLLLFAGCMQLGSSVVYYLFCRNKDREMLT